MKNNKKFYLKIASLSLISLISLIVIVTFKSSASQQARALPFGGSCYSFGIFDCSDYAYEYCQYNTPSACWILQITDSSSAVVTKKINIVSKQVTEASKTTTQYSVIDPRNTSEAVIASWKQNVGTALNIPNDAKTNIISKYPDVFPGGGSVSRLVSTVTPGTEIYPKVEKPYWSNNGYFPLTTLRKVTDTFLNSQYQVPRIPVCSDFEGKTCDLRYRPSLYENGGLNYSAVACQSDSGRFPRVSACINDPKPVDPAKNAKWRKILLDETNPMPRVDLDVVLPNACSVDQLKSSDNITLVASSTALSDAWMSPNMGDVRGVRAITAKAEFYINGTLVGTAEGSNLPLSVSINASTYKGTNASTTRSVMTKVSLYSTYAGVKVLVGTYESGARKIESCPRITKSSVKVFLIDPEGTKTDLPPNLKIKINSETPVATNPYSFDRTDTSVIIAPSVAENYTVKVYTCTYPDGGTECYLPSSGGVKQFSANVVCTNGYCPFTTPIVPNRITKVYFGYYPVAFNYSYISSSTRTVQGIPHESFSIRQGETISIPIQTYDAVGAVKLPVTTRLSNLPAGVTVSSWSNNSCTPNCASVVKITASPDAPLGTKTITVTGVPLNKTKTFDLQVKTAPVSVTCSSTPASSKSLTTNFTFTAEAVGGDGGYTYAWTGSDTLTGGDYKAIAKKFTTPGDKYFTVEVRSGDSAAMARCNINITLPKIIGNIITVDPTGKAANSVTNFKDGAALLGPGKTLKVLPGIYKDTLTILNSGTAASPITVDLTGVTIDGEKNRENGINTVAAKYVTIKGGTVIHHRSRYFNKNVAAVSIGAQQTIQNSIIKDNYAIGLGLVDADNTRVLGVEMNHNVDNINGGGDNILIKDSKILNSNFGTTEIAPSKMASDKGLVQKNGLWYRDTNWELNKFARTSNLVVDNLLAQGNNGEGLWLDIDNKNYTIKNSKFINNSIGFFTEINPGQGLIQKNTFQGDDSLVLPSIGLMVAESSNVVVENNTFLYSRLLFRAIPNRTGVTPTPRLYNVSVRNNTMNNSFYQTTKHNPAQNITWDKATMSAWKISIKGTTFTNPPTMELYRWGDNGTDTYKYYTLESVRDTLGFEK